MTNFEKIKQMSAEQFTTSGLLGCHACICYTDAEYCAEHSCVDSIKEWLNQEAEE